MDRITTAPNEIRDRCPMQSKLLMVAFGPIQASSPTVVFPLIVLLWPMKQRFIGYRINKVLSDEEWTKYGRKPAKLAIFF